uniref:RNA-directed DNA polymerase, eukaryota, reverse transcriptase zinc-binding domain protein n=1 Tax=Lactuca sativa TaxID=4236 RepID=A0A9R1XRI0_LACSA|nr:hypothetical protein LSAT_V11C200061880 [Lactuca sativa]
MASLLGCEPSTLPFNYLGVPVGANIRLKIHWQPVIDRFQDKLSQWKAKSLSFGGRLTLIKSVLSNLPTYFMSLFVAPVGVIEKLERIKRRFLWGGSVIASKETGGLGVGSLNAFNTALIVKWWWRFRKDPGSIWAKAITSMHKLQVWNNIACSQKELNKLGISVDMVLEKNPLRMVTHGHAH